MNRRYIVKTQNQYKEEKKQERKLHLEEYNKNKTRKEVYQKYDSKSVPGLLFFHHDLNLNELLGCLYVTEDSCIPNLEQERIEWLKKHQLMDVYTQLHERIYQESILKKYSLRVSKLENKIRSENPLESIDELETIIQEYVQLKSKSKKAKENLNNIIELLTKKVSHTKIRWDIFFSSLYNIAFPINLFHVQNSAIALQINQYILDFKETSMKLEQEKHFLDNMFQHLHVQLLKYIQDYQTLLNNPVITQSKKFIGVNWSKMSLEQQFDRFKSFSEYYIKKHNTLSSEPNHENLIHKLYTCLCAQLTRIKHSNITVSNGIKITVQSLKSKISRMIQKQSVLLYKKQKQVPIQIIPLHLY